MMSHSSGLINGDKVDILMVMFHLMLWCNWQTLLLFKIRVSVSSQEAWADTTICVWFWVTIFNQQPLEFIIFSFFLQEHCLAETSAYKQGGESETDAKQKLLNFCSEAQRTEGLLLFVRTPETERSFKSHSEQFVNTSSICCNRLLSFLHCRFFSLTMEFSNNNN